MQRMMFQTIRRKTGRERVEELWRKTLETVYYRTDRMFASLLVIQWLALVLVAWLVTPNTWIGSTGALAYHIWGSIGLGAVLAGAPLYLIRRYPGRTRTRHAVAVGQMLTSALFIHLTGGRIETHFHVFGSLAFLSFYRDWKVLATATAVEAIDHVIRGIFWPESVFGLWSSSPWRWMEHVAWALFADLFLFLGIRQSAAEMWDAAMRRTNLEASERRMEQAQRVAHVGSWEWEVADQAMTWSAEQFRLMGVDPTRTQPSRALYLSCIHPADRGVVEAWLQEAIRSQDSARINHRIIRADGKVRILHSRTDVVLDEYGQVVRLVGTSQDVTERERAEEIIRASELKFRSVTEHVGEAIVSADERGGIVLWNRAAELIFGYTEEEALGRPWTILVPSAYHERLQMRMEQLKEAPPGTSFHAPGEWDGIKKDGSTFPLELTLSYWRRGGQTFQTGIIRDISQRKEAEAALRQANEVLEARVVDRTAELTRANEELQAEIAERREAEAKLEAAHQQLIDTSRQAGMAEVATSVLHNVGNVLNSVNISCSTLLSTIERSGLDYLARAVELANRRSGDLGDFLSSDPVGRRLPEFLRQLAQRLHGERETMRHEVEQLSRRIDHIKEIVTMQQSYGQVSGVTEVVKVSDLVEDSLRMNADSLVKHGISLETAFSEVPPVRTQKHKVLQILVNLVHNAIHACDESGRTDKQIRVETRMAGGMAQILIADNGVGIAPENLTRVFSLGFTTRRHGHGFGLHSSVIAAQELDGSLIACSDGLGCGATFVLDLPLQPAS